MFENMEKYNLGALAYNGVLNIGITHVFFLHKQLPGPEEAVWTRGRLAESFNIVRGTRQVLMQWHQHVWSLFLHILPDNSINSAENVA